MLCQLVSGGIRGWGRVRQLPPGVSSSPLERPSPTPLVPLLSWAHQCCVCGGFRLVRITYGTGRGHGEMQRGRNMGREKVKVTGVDPPSLTARMPSPRPLRLRNQQQSVRAVLQASWTDWHLHCKRKHHEWKISEKQAQSNACRYQCGVLFYSICSWFVIEDKNRFILYIKLFKASSFCFC